MAAERRSALNDLPQKYEMPDGRRYSLVKVHGSERLFDFENGQYYKPNSFSKKNKAHFMRVRAGVNLAISKSERLDFLTLSTQYNKAVPEKRLERIEDLNYAWTKLKQKIEYYWQKEQYMRFCRKNHLEPYEIHGRKLSVKHIEYWAMFVSKLRYIKVKTSEGGGVLHVIFRKPKDYPPIPKNWLHKQWQNIWGSWNTSIHEVPISDAYRTSSYVVGQYFANQPIVRLSYGQQWVFPGFVKSFRNVVDTYARMKQSPDTPQKHKPFKRAIEVWNKNIANGSLPKGSRQRSIFGTPGKDGKWHSKRYTKPKLGNIGIVGCDFNVWKEKIHLKWWNCRIDSPKYLSSDGWHITIWIKK